MFSVIVFLTTCFASSAPNRSARLLSTQYVHPEVLLEVTQATRRGYSERTITAPPIDPHSTRTGTAVSSREGPPRHRPPPLGGALVVEPVVREPGVDLNGEK